MSKKDYYIGLDVGTNSVGWAVTDERYKLLRAKGKDLWGVRLFEEGETAEERRINRSSRRRTQRKTWRRELLREVFEEQVNLVDSEFFKRMDESKYHLEDKKVDTKYSLFNDPNYTDEDYYEEYPTIFHLRKALMESEDKKDIRLYFLAINQMMKRRGHFLFEGQNIEAVNDVKDPLKELDTYLKDPFYGFDIEEDDLDDNDYTYLLEVLLDDHMGKMDKKRNLKNHLKEKQLDKDKNKQMAYLVDLLVSGIVDLDKLFNDEAYKEIENNKIDFSKEDFDIILEELESEINEKVELIRIVKAIYDYCILQTILKGEKSISIAQVERYDKHKQDLIDLKKLIRKYDKDDAYFKMFRDKDSKKGYSNYIGKVSKSGKSSKVEKCSNEDFFKNLKTTLKICDEDDPEYTRIVNEIDLELFLPKQISNKNSVIPYQIHLLELEKILDNLVRDYPSFLEFEDGVTKKEKISMLFKFRIPYYVGPLNPHNKNSGGKTNTWIVKKEGKENESITPWNFSDVVDEKACEHEFIRRMTNKCTYLTDKDVVPKNSVIYQKYLVLNELNNIKVDDAKLEPELKMEIFNDIYLKKRTVKIKDIKAYLKSKNYLDNNSEAIFTGFDNELKESMSTYVQLKNILSDDYSDQIAEDIVEYNTIHSGNSKLIMEKINDKYSLPEKTVKKLSNLNYSGWARFSKELLVDLEASSLETGEIGSIIYFLENTQDNFMQILSYKYTFSEKIEEYQSQFINKDFSYDLVDNLNISPSVKKMAWQTLKIIKELIKVIGYEPKKIFLEMARGKEEIPTRKKSRKDQMLDLYKNIKDEEREWTKEIEKHSESQFRSKKLFLYYTQMGKCMYTGERIDLHELFASNKYDIDHIIPRSVKKDDSLINNLVLVKRDTNQRIKGDKYPVPDEFRNKMANYWKYLYRNNLISKTKYERLIRSTPLTADELAGFINRQLVETRQTTKVVADLLKQVFSDTNIVYVKAGLVSEFRQENDIYKVRELNNLHHAHDAYLNIVVGNVYNIKFTNNPLNFVKKNRGKYSIRVKSTFNKDIRDRSNNIIWNPEKDIGKIKKTLDKPSPLKTIESIERSGGLFDVNLIGASNVKEGNAYLPIKDKRMTDISKYGAYNTIKGAYFTLVEHSKKGKRVKTLETVPIFLSKKIEDDPNVLNEYLIYSQGLIDPIVIIDKILYKTLVEINGFKYTINSKQNTKTHKRVSLQPAEEPFWSLSDSNKYKELFRLYNEINEYDTLQSEVNESNLDELLNMTLNKINSTLYKKRINVPEVVKEVNFLNNNYSNEDKVTIIYNLYHLLTPTLQASDLRLIKGSKNSGKVTFNNEVKEKDSIKLIYQSITGVYEKEVKL